MKKQIILMSLLLSTVAGAQTEVSRAPVKHLYIPEGFDTNDSVELVVTGTFPSPCYARNTVKVNVIEDKIKIEISAIRRDTKAMCPQMQVPYKEVVSVGNLQGGSYDVQVNDKLTDKLVVQEATSNSVDDHLYAAIDRVEKVGANDYVLHGWRYSHCVQFDRVQVVSNGKDTLSILPVMKQVNNFCPMKGMPVAYPVKLDFAGLINEPLIHVRTMDGKSFNTVLNQENQR
jgi:hypothetical protein